MKTLKDVAVGDEIVMVYRTGSKSSNDRIVRAQVTEAKRVNLTVETIGDIPYPRTWNVRRDNGHVDGNNTYYGWHAYPVEMWEQREREAKAHTLLRDQKIRVEPGSPWSGREIELANLIIASEQGGVPL